jgi:hypothetical protein
LPFLQSKMVGGADKATFKRAKRSEQSGATSHLRNQKEKRTLGVRFSFADYGGLRFEPCGARSLWKLQAQSRRRKGCRFCKAKWSAVPTRQPLSVRSAASKAGQHPTPTAHPLPLSLRDIPLSVPRGGYE